MLMVGSQQGSCSRSAPATHSQLPWRDTSEQQTRGRLSKVMSETPAGVHTILHRGDDNGSNFPAKQHQTVLTPGLARKGTRDFKFVVSKNIGFWCIVAYINLEMGTNCLGNTVALLQKQTRVKHSTTDLPPCKVRLGPLVSDGIT